MPMTSVIQMPKMKILDFVQTLDFKNVWILIVLGAIILVSKLIFSAIYNIFFHPLRNIPGPLLAKISSIWVARYWVNGRYPYAIKEAHDKYGSIVRTGPDEVSCCSASSWKEVYGHVVGRKTFLKSEWYSVVPEEFPHVSSARDANDHSALRKTFSHGFSARALSEQEGVVQQFIDLLILQLHKNCSEVPGDIVKWYNYATFDIIGDLTFGESFGSLSSGEMHFWVALIFSHIKSGTLYRTLLWFPLMKKVANVLYSRSFLPKTIVAARKKYNQYARELMAKRINDDTEKYDFLSKPLAEAKSNEITRKSNLSIEHVRSTANLFIVAGSETTATALSALTFYLGRNPRVYLKLASEIREKFSKYEEINGNATENLAYLKAVIEEALRLYPPVPIGMPRVSPGEVVEGHYLPQGTITYVSSWSATHSEINFHDPFEFLPERWLGSNATDHKEASQPFLLGSRVCLGRKYENNPDLYTVFLRLLVFSRTVTLTTSLSLALLEIRIILAKILWTFDFQLSSTVGQWDLLSDCFLVWQKPPLPTRFTRRPNVHVPCIDG